MDEIISAQEFVDKYELCYEKYEDSIEKEVSGSFFLLLSNLHLDLAYFEPNEEIRKENLKYFGEKFLREKVKGYFEKLKES